MPCFTGLFESVLLGSPYVDLHQETAGFSPKICSSSKVRIGVRHKASDFSKFAFIMNRKYLDPTYGQVKSSPALSSKSDERRIGHE